MKFPIENVIFFKVRFTESSSENWKAVTQQRLGYVLRSELQALRQALTFISVILQCQYAIENEREKEKNFF